MEWINNTKILKVLPEIFDTVRVPKYDVYVNISYTFFQICIP
jgi:hypothetical protein